jgi:2-polyprenyl-3-methyl-5-hydroxy-6-metoxy-1,4-benzoquinol methylase
MENKPLGDQRVAFANLNFEDFKRLALDGSLTNSEKIGFPNEYRQGLESTILRDIINKVSAISISGSRILDIGIGCGELAKKFAEHAERINLNVDAIDSSEVLSQLPDSLALNKIPGKFPDQVNVEIKKANYDAVLIYSVFHYIYPESGCFKILDDVLPLLAPGGQLLIGDIPNVSMLRRFLASEAGQEYHKKYTGTDSVPQITLFPPLAGNIDDSVIIAMQMYARNAGFHAYILPQNPELPMSNRREDLLINKP